VGISDVGLLGSWVAGYNYDFYGFNTTSPTSQSKLISFILHAIGVLDRHLGAMRLDVSKGIGCGWLVPS
jgi:hypothetical protein